MDGTRAEPDSRRRRRAVSLIASAVIVLTVVAAAYLFSTSTPKPNQPTSPSPSPVSALSYLVSYDFVNLSLGWALVRLGPQRAVRGFMLVPSDDGGQHWLQQFMATGTAAQGRIVAGLVRFFNPSNGFMGVSWDQFNLLYRTADGGLHWTMVGLPTTGVGTIVNTLSFSDSSHGWFLAQTSVGPNRLFNLYATDNGGDTWRQLADPPSDSITTTFRGPSEGWLGSTGIVPPHVYKSNDGGRTWQRRGLPRPTDVQPDASSWSTRVILLPDAGVLAFVAGGGTLVDYYELTSFDSGASWRYGSSRRSSSGFGGVLSFQDAQRWWAIDGTNLYKSPDAGQTWTLVSQELPNGMGACQIFDSMHAWARFDSEDRGLLRTDDGGLHWSRVTIPVPTSPG